MGKRPHAARKPAADPKPSAPPPDVQALARAKQERRATACLEEVQQVLARHGCIILPRVLIVGKEVQSDWGVRPLDL